MRPATRPSKPLGCRSRRDELVYCAFSARNLHEQRRQRQIVENGAILLGSGALLLCMESALIGQAAALRVA
jgi:hypothetical protein